MFQQVNVAPVAIYAVPPTQEADASFTIIALALDSNNLQTTYTAPATLSIKSGPGVFVSGGSSVSAFFIGGKVKFSGLFFTTSGTYHLKVTSGSLSSQDIMLTV